MDKKNKNEIIVNRIKETINRINNNDFTLYFFTIDSRNVPNGSISYIYNLAKELKDEGYNVKMIYQLENEYSPNELEELKRKDLAIDENRTFIGVKDWMGEEYGEIEHLNIDKEEWKISPSDFLFIPEVFSSLMFQTFKHKIPCKRYVILQNYNYISEFIPLGVEWANYGITEVISNSQTQLDLVKGIFPYVKGKVLNPFISGKFRKPVTAKKLIVNVISKNQSDINRVIKPFYWRYPVYKFISFRELRNFPQDRYAEMLKEGAITLWIDDETPFGYSALEAMRCGNIVVGKIPEVIPEWMKINNEVSNSCILFENINDVPDILANVIGSWMQDEIPHQLLDDMEKTNALYTEDEWKTNVSKIIGELKEERIKELDSLTKFNTNQSVKKS